MLRPARVELDASRAAIAGAAPQALLLDEYRTHDADARDRRDAARRATRRRRHDLAGAAPRTRVRGSRPRIRSTGCSPASAADGVVRLTPVAFAVSRSTHRRASSCRNSARSSTSRCCRPRSQARATGGRRRSARGARRRRRYDCRGRARREAASRSRCAASRATRSPASRPRAVERRTLATPARVTALAIDARQRNLYAGTADGRLLRFDLRGGEAPPEIFSAGSAGVSALGLLIGGRTLVVGQQDGNLSAWFAVPQPDGPARFTRVREFPRYPGAIAQLAPSQRDRSFFAASSDGTLGLQHSTSGRTLWRAASPVGAASALAFAPKGDGAALATPGKLASFAVAAPHPELSLASLFGRVWYEERRSPGVRVAVVERRRRLRAEAVAGSAAGRHAQGNLLRAAARGAARRARRDVHLAVHASAPAALREAGRRADGGAAERGARLPRRALARAARRAPVSGLPRDGRGDPRGGDRGRLALGAPAKALACARARWHRGALDRRGDRRVDGGLRRDRRRRSRRCSSAARSRSGSSARRASHSSSATPSWWGSRWASR